MKKVTPLTIAALFTVLSGLAVAQTNPLSSHVENKTKADDCVVAEVNRVFDSEALATSLGKRNTDPIIVEGPVLEKIKSECVKKTGEPLGIQKSINRHELRNFDFLMRIH